MDQLLTKVATPEVKILPKSAPARYWPYRLRKVKPQRCSCGMWVVFPKGIVHQRSRTHKLAPVVRKLHNQGVSNLEISRRLDIVHVGVLNILRSFNRDRILPRPAPPVPRRCSCGMWVVYPNAKYHRLGELHKIARKVERLNKKNLTRQQIARKLRTNHDKVVSILKRLKRPRQLLRRHSQRRAAGVASM